MRNRIVTILSFFCSMPVACFGADISHGSEVMSLEEMRGEAIYEEIILAQRSFETGKESHNPDDFIEALKHFDMAFLYGERTAIQDCKEVCAYLDSLPYANEILSSERIWIVDEIMKSDLEFAIKNIVAPLEETHADRIFCYFRKSRRKMAIRKRIPYLIAACRHIWSAHMHVLDGVLERLSEMVRVVMTREGPVNIRSILTALSTTSKLTNACKECLIKLCLKHEDTFSVQCVAKKRKKKSPHENKISKKRRLE